MDYLNFIFAKVAAQISLNVLDTNILFSSYTSELIASIIFRALLNTLDTKTERCLETGRTSFT